MRHPGGRLKFYNDRMTRRFSAAFALVFFAASSAVLAAPRKSPQAHQVCRGRCDQNYQLCRSHATNKQARKGCKVAHKNCKTSCR